MHGLHAENQLQLAFFVARKKALRRTPKCIRGLTIVKAGGDISHSKLKGAIEPEEILAPALAAKDKGVADLGDFLEIDPKDGFNVRNFQIQACKMATVSDIVVYGDGRTPRQEVERLAKCIARAQTAWQKRTEGLSGGPRLFNTFVLTGKSQRWFGRCAMSNYFADDFTSIEATHPELVAIDSDGCMTGNVMDFFHWERLEMCAMSAATEISRNVWLGPTPDPTLGVGADGLASLKDPGFDIMIEASDLAQMPDFKSFEVLDELLTRKDGAELAENAIPQLEFPGSGAIMPPTWSQTEVDGLLSTLEWMHKQANGQPFRVQRRDSKLSMDADGDSIMHSADDSASQGRRLLIHCTDGYTESSMLALAYYMYAECVPVHEAWLQLHREKGRNFFAYGSDVALLRAVQPRILQASPKHSGSLTTLCPKTPDWLERMDGSLPSRVLDYMYLGNLGHANNPGLLKELGVGQVLSIGEPVLWPKDVRDSWPREHLLYVDRVQDNGVDPLTSEFTRCLEFIGKFQHITLCRR